jgi:hypothetical protein
MWGGLAMVTCARDASHRAEVQPLVASAAFVLVIAIGSIVAGTWLAFRTITQDHSAYGRVPALFPYGVQGPGT